MKENKRPSSSLPKVSPRAPRFVINVPVRCRERNQEKLREGRAENISPSCTLFRAPEPLTQDSIEVSFALPTLLRSGKSIRTILPLTSDESPTISIRTFRDQLVERSK